MGGALLGSPHSCLLDVTVRTDRNTEVSCLMQVLIAKGIFFMDIYNSHVRKVISALYRLICDYHDRQAVRPLSPDLEAVWQRSMAHFRKSIQCMDYVHNRTVNDPIWRAAIKRGESDQKIRSIKK